MQTKKGRPQPPLIKKALLHAASRVGESGIQHAGQQLRDAVNHKLHGDGAQNHTHKPDDDLRAVGADFIKNITRSHKTYAHDGGA